MCNFRARIGSTNSSIQRYPSFSGGRHCRLLVHRKQKWISIGWCLCSSIEETDSVWGFLSIVNEIERMNQNINLLTECDDHCHAKVKRIRYFISCSSTFLHFYAHLRDSNFFVKTTYQAQYRIIYHYFSQGHFSLPIQVRQSVHVWKGQRKWNRSFYGVKLYATSLIMLPNSLDIISLYHYLAA